MQRVPGHRARQPHHHRHAEKDQPTARHGLPRPNLHDAHRAPLRRIHRFRQHLPGNAARRGVRQRRERLPLGRVHPLGIGQRHQRAVLDLGLQRHRRGQPRARSHRTTARSRCGLLAEGRSAAGPRLRALLPADPLRRLFRHEQPRGQSGHPLCNRTGDGRHQALRPRNGRPRRSNTS